MKLFKSYKIFDLFSHLNLLLRNHKNEDMEISPLFHPITSFAWSKKTCIKFRMEGNAKYPYFALHMWFYCSSYQIWIIFGLVEGYNGESQNEIVCEWENISFHSKYKGDMKEIDTSFLVFLYRGGKTLVNDVRFFIHQKMNF